MTNSMNPKAPAFMPSSGVAGTNKKQNETPAFKFNNLETHASDNPFFESKSNTPKKNQSMFKMMVEQKASGQTGESKTKILTGVCNDCRAKSSR